MKIIGTKEIKENLKNEDKEALLSNHFQFHIGWNRLRKDLSFGNWNRDNIVEWHAFVTEKLRDMGVNMKPRMEDSLDRASLYYEKALVSSDIPSSLQPGNIIMIPGKILPEPYGKMVWEGEKKALVSSQEWKKYIERPVYLVEKDLVLGIISISKPQKIGLEDFKRFEKEHGISEEKRKEWWGDKKEFYYYNIELISKFEPPKQIRRNEKAKNWISSVAFKNSKFKWGDPKLMSDKELLEQHDTLHGYFKSIPKDYTKNDIANFHYLVVSEMKKRNIEHMFNDELDKIKKGIVVDGDSIIFMPDEEEKEEVDVDTAQTWAKMAYKYVFSQQSPEFWKVGEEQEKIDSVFRALNEFKNIYPIKEEWNDYTISFLAGKGTVLANIVLSILKGEAYSCECLDCGYRFGSSEHCRDSNCPKCGSNNIRRANRPGIGS